MFVFVFPSQDHNNPKGTLFPLDYAFPNNYRRAICAKKMTDVRVLWTITVLIQSTLLPQRTTKFNASLAHFVRDGDTGLRLFSRVECLRLQGYPDDFLLPVSRMQVYRQLGNSVSVPVATAIAKAIMHSIRPIDPLGAPIVSLSASV